MYQTWSAWLPYFWRLTQIKRNTVGNEILMSRLVRGMLPLMQWAAMMGIEIGL